MKKNKLYQVFALGLTGALIVGAVFLWQSGFLSKLLGDKEAPTIPSYAWSLAIQEVHDVWNGKVDLDTPNFKNHCPRLYMEKDVIPKALKSCRRDILNCYFQKDSKIKIKNEFLPLKVILHETNSFEMRLGGESKKFSLNDECREVTLPEGFYWGDDRLEKKERLWHTSGITYHVDRFLVRNIDIPKKAKTLKGAALFDPVDDLLPHEMVEYCKGRGGEVLSSHVKAALTYHHGRKEMDDFVSTPPGWNTAEHPFGPRKEESPQFLVKKGAPFEKSFCHKIFSKECRDLNYYDYFPSALGWSGVGELLGGLPEFVLNNEFPRKNLHPSSFYHEMKSDAHQAGKRIFWSGRGFRRMDFNFSTVDPFGEEFSEFKVGFRCMRMEYEEGQ